LRTVQDFTSDPNAIADAFERLDSGSAAPSGRMLDAVEMAAKMFAGSKANSRRVLLIISESRDRGSKIKLDRAVELVQQVGIVVYAATYSTRKRKRLSVLLLKAGERIFHSSNRVGWTA
ncbi:MAG: hypothetical protein ABSB67_12025, partial [Bryobacteraceae bacterium]